MDTYTLLLRRGQAADLSALAAAEGLLAGEPYLCLDTGTLAVGLSASRYSAYDSPLITRTAGSTVSALKAVKVEDGLAYPASADAPGDGARLVGVAVTGAGAGETLSLRASGVLSDAAWNWSPGTVYLGLAGDLTQTPPSSGVLVAVGRALAAHDLLINPQPPVRRS